VVHLRRALKPLRVPAIAAAAVALAGATGCSEEEPTQASCGTAADVSLCVTVDGTTRNVRRLADSAARPTRGAVNRAARLVAMPVPDRTAEVSVQPAKPLKLVETTLYRSVDVLGREAPIDSAECAVTSCGRWATTVSDARRTVRVPAKDIRPGNVLIVAAFVQTQTNVQQISWGVVFRTTASPQ